MLIRQSISHLTIRSVLPPDDCGLLLLLSLFSPPEPQFPHLDSAGEREGTEHMLGLPSSFPGKESRVVESQAPPPALQVPPRGGVPTCLRPQPHGVGFLQDLCHRPAGVEDGGTAQIDSDPLGPGDEVGQAQGQLKVVAQQGWLQHLELAGDAGLGGGF